MQNKLFIKSRRARNTPFSRRVEASGVSGYTMYNHMLLPAVFKSPEEDYKHLCEHVQVWDVSCERQVEITGPDAAKLVQLMTPRDLSKIDLLQGKYAPICNAEGFILNDPIVIKLTADRWWVSIADSDIKLFAQGLAQGYGLDAKVFEPDVFPLAVQGPKSDELMARVFGDKVRDIRFFRGEMLPFQGIEMYVARSGWSKQGGFEIYVPKVSVAEPLWDELFAQGTDLNVRAGCPNSIERIEAGLLSYGTDMDEFDTPLECGLDNYLNLDADIESLSIAALRAKVGKQTRKLVGLAFDKPIDMQDSQNHIGGFDVYVNDDYVGEVRAQVWSVRYNKLLVHAMINMDYLNDNDSLTVGGQTSKFLTIPFDPKDFDV